MTETSDLSARSTPANKNATQVDNSNRLTNTTLCIPFVYGSVAFFLGKKADEYHTHRWTLYVRGPNNEDLSMAISKVVFQLHPSFPQPVRELTSAPFEVTERGWGEFEAGIRIFWKDPNEKAILVTHGIKLYPPGMTQVTPTNTKEPVVSEHYDEAVFTDPVESFYRQAMRASVAPKIQSNEPAVQTVFGIFTDDEDFKFMMAANEFLEKELEVVKGKLLQVDQDISQIDKELMEVEEARAAKKSTSPQPSSGGKTKAPTGASGSSKRAKT